MEKQTDNVDITAFYTVETYSVFHNIDRSIFATNSFLRKFGYEFVCLNLHELERKFATLFSLPKKFNPEVQVHLHGTDISISNEFFFALKDCYLFGYQVILTKEDFFLKAIKNANSQNFTTLSLLTFI